METPRRKSPFLINRNFTLLWAGQIVSAFGDYLFDTTLTLWIVTKIAYGQSWAPLAVGAVLLAAAFPVFLIGPIAGVFVDRWDKRQTMLRMDCIRALLIGLLIPLALLNGVPAILELGIICVLVFLTSACAQFFNPSVLALTGDIVEEPQRARATGLTQMMYSLALLAGPPLATLLFFAAGLQVAIIFNALSFMVSFLLVLLMQAPPAARSVAEGLVSNFWCEFAGGLHFFFGNRVLITILIAGFLVVLFEGALNTLGVFFLQQNLHTSLSLYGFLGMAMGAGLTLGALLAGAFAQRLGVTRVLSIGLTLSGVAAIVYARLTSFPPALVITFLIGLLTGSVNVAVGPILFHTTPRELIGRVAAAVTPALALSSILSIALVSYLDGTLLHNFHASLLGIQFGPIDSIFLATGVLATLGGGYAMLTLRGVHIADTEEPGQPEPGPGLIGK
ncbi:MAG: MFS transporter [Chloroflexota bacterium]|nr:MFS transporter [Chloroflexota bacterium]